jgi:hypothetical protein
MTPSATIMDVPTEGVYSMLMCFYDSDGVSAKEFRFLISYVNANFLTE